MPEGVDYSARIERQVDKSYNDGWRNGVRAALQTRQQLAENTECDCNRCVLEALQLDPEDGA